MCNFKNKGVIALAETKAKNSNRYKSRLMGIVLSLGVIAGTSVITYIGSAENRKTVSVVKLKQGVSANQMITDDLIEEYEMYYKEFENYGVVNYADGSKRKAVITWDDRDKIVGKKYAAYYLRKDTVVFWDNFVSKQTRKNSYLYEMDGELLNIKMNTTDFGDMVVPGDTLNIRCRYQKPNYDLPSEEAYRLSGNKSTVVTETVTEMLFNEVTVLDMLNSNGSSIFDIYYEYISWSKSKQAQSLKDSNFLASVKPSTILLEVTPEEAERFMEMSGRNPQYLMTLLPRTGSSSIIDSLADIQSALNSK